MKPYYSDDFATIYHGDCREVLAWLEADVLVTDPPYGIHHALFGMNEPVIAGETRTGRASDRELTDEHVAIRDDALALWGPKPALVFGHWRAPRPSRTQMRLVWDREIQNGVGGVGPWRPGDEEVYVINWVNPKGAARGPVVSSVLRGHPTLRGNDRPNHPTPKPVSLLRELLAPAPAGVIADPFMGSGSTLLAAKDLGRKAIGIEVEERYCEIAARRLAQEVLDFGGVA